MRKGAFSQLLRAEEQVKTYYHEAQWKQKRDMLVIISAALLVMSIFNVIQRSYPMLAATLSSGIGLPIFVLAASRKKNVGVLENGIFLVIMILFSYFIIAGGNDGFAIMWVLLVPYFYMLMIDLKKGILLNLYFLLLLVLLFYGPLDVLLGYDYPKMIRLRFPMLYVIDCIFSLYSAKEMIMARSNAIAYQNELRRAGFYDPATGLKNRIAYTYFVQNREARDGGDISAIFIDVNGLHAINNAHGHEAGDNMLRAVANLCVKHFGADNVYRIGGDEFLVFDQHLDGAQLESEIDALCAEVGDRGYSIAYGVARGKSEDDLRELVKSADQRMLKNKAEYYKLHDRRGR